MDLSFPVNCYFFVRFVVVFIPHTNISLSLRNLTSSVSITFLPHLLNIRHVYKCLPLLRGTTEPVGSITSRCSGKEPALLSLSSRGGTKTRLERAAEIEPLNQSLVPRPSLVPFELLSYSYNTGQAPPQGGGGGNSLIWPVRGRAAGQGMRVCPWSVLNRV